MASSGRACQALTSSATASVTEEIRLGETSVLYISRLLQPMDVDNKTKTEVSEPAASDFASRISPRRECLIRKKDL
jgi:hypothetical protein